MSRTVEIFTESEARCLQPRKAKRVKPYRLEMRLKGWAAGYEHETWGGWRAAGHYEKLRDAEKALKALQHRWDKRHDWIEHRMGAQ